MLSVRRLNEIINEVLDEEASNGPLSSEAYLNYANQLNICLEELENVRTNSNSLNQFTYQMVQFLNQLVPVLYRLYQQGNNQVNEAQFGFVPFLNWLNSNGVKMPSSLMAGVNGYNAGFDWVKKQFAKKKAANRSKANSQNQKPQQQKPNKQQEPQQEPQQQDYGYDDQQADYDDYGQQDQGYDDQQQDYGYEEPQQQDQGYDDQQQPQQYDDVEPEPYQWPPKQDAQGQQGPTREPEPLSVNPAEEYRTLMYSQYPQLRSAYVTYRQMLLPYSSVFNRAFTYLEELYKTR